MDQFVKDTRNLTISDVATGNVEVIKMKAIHNLDQKLSRVCLDLKDLEDSLNELPAQVPAHTGHSKAPYPRKSLQIPLLSQTGHRGPIKLRHPHPVHALSKGKPHQVKEMKSCHRNICKEKSTAFFDI